MTGRKIDSVYYRDGLKIPLSMRALVIARDNMFKLFMSEMQPNGATTIVDIGVSDEENEGANFLEKMYPWPQNVTCAGLGNGEAIVRAYPSVKFRQIEPGAPLPFTDGEFDIACSNAVLEHVGGAGQRRTFIEEALRVARAVFITVPNRWFPVEHHTGLPLIHFCAPLFRSALSASKYAYWTDPVNVEFLSAARLRREWPWSSPAKVLYAGLNLGPFSSNLALVARR